MREYVAMKPVLCLDAPANDAADGGASPPEPVDFGRWLARVQAELRVAPAAAGDRLARAAGDSSQFSPSRDDSRHTP